MARRGTRPARGEIDEAALRLLARHGGQILATARRHAVTPEDAEDAYQRGIEILLTKAPSTSEDELIPWLKTVVKHEAWALRRQRERHSPVTDDGELRDRPAPTSVTHEQAERLERLRLGAEALGHLKPHEVRALRLKAEGFSYREICAMTGWSYTKVKIPDRGAARVPAARVRHPARQRVRPLRAAALRAGGRRGERRGPGAAAPAHADLPELPSRAARVPRAPERVASGCRRRRWWRATAAVRYGACSSRSGGRPAKTAAMGERLHAAAELATGQKVAAVAASAAALAGGGTAIDEFANHQPAPRRLRWTPYRRRRPTRRRRSRPAPPPLPPAAAPPAATCATPAPPPKRRPLPTRSRERIRPDGGATTGLDVAPRRASAEGDLGIAAEAARAAGVVPSGSGEFAP